MHILIVDDDDYYRQAQIRILKRFRLPNGEQLYVSNEACSGNEALAKLKDLTAARIDCLLLDQQMPGRRGESWLEDIVEAAPDAAIIMITGWGMPGMGGGLKAMPRIHEIDPSAKVILATGYLDQNVPDKVTEKGACALLGKPFRMAKLYEIVRKVLDGEAIEPDSVLGASAIRCI
jgi:DNA-binding NarL/FixJ family response regulator